MTTATIFRTDSTFDERLRELTLFAPRVDNEFAVNSFLASWPYLTGELPYHRDVEIRLDAAADTALPAGTVLRESRTMKARSWLLSGDGWVAAVTRYDAGSQWLSISSVDEAIATAVIESVRPAEAAASPDADRVDMSFVHCGPHGSVHNRRKVLARSWAEIRRNYVPAVAERFDALAELTGEALPTGRVLLMHGPPGTGKTTLLRALARAWSPWCATEVVVDPEELFGRPSYMFDVILDDSDDDDDRWTMLVLEDCDELLRAEAKERTGQALSRLLNVADGLVGQGLRVLVCLTTNEPVQRLHPALRRPGRCLAEVEVRRFSRAEAAAWLDAPLRTPGDSFSLAELLAIATGSSLTPPDIDHPHIGQYL